MAHVHHPAPSAEEAEERGRMRRAKSDGAQAAIWTWFLVMLTVLIALGLAWGLRQRFWPRAPELAPELPTLPGKPPEPRLQP